MVCKNCPYMINGVFVKIGLCDECVLNDWNKSPKEQKKKSTKQSRREAYKKHLQTLISANANSVYFNSFKKPKGRIVKNSYGCSSWVRYYKRYSNRIIRRYKKSYMPRGQWCKRLFDFWWTID